MPYQQGVIFIKDPGIAGKFPGETGLQLIIGQGGVPSQMSCRYPASVGVNDKYRLIKGVEENGVGGFPTDPPAGEQQFPFAAQIFRRRRGE